MKQLKILGLAAVAAMALTATLGAGSASASVLKQLTASGTDTLGVGAVLELTLESGNSMLTEDSFGFTAMTCTGSTLKGTLERVTPTGQPKSKVSTLDFTGCPEKHSLKVLANGELEIRNIAGTTNGTVFSSGARVSVFNTLLSQTCITETGASTDIGTLTGATSATGKATLDINGLLPLSGCSASNARWTGKYEVTSPLGLIAEPS